MAKYYGEIGYGVVTEIAPGVWSKEPVVREVFGDIYKDSSKTKKSDRLNDDIIVQLKISFLADPYALTNYSNIIYATNMGTKWKVVTAEIQHPRIILTLGDVYTKTDADYTVPIIDPDSPPRYVLIQQLIEAYNTAYSTNYKEVSLNDDGDVVSIDIWENDTKELKLFTKTVVYESGEVSEVKTIDEISGWILIKVLTYPDEHSIIITEEVTNEL